MFRLGMTALTFLFLASSAHAMDAMIELPSALPPHSSLDKPEAIAKARGMIVFVRIDHAAGARGIGQELRPTEVIIFGHPPKATPPCCFARKPTVSICQCRCWPGTTQRRQRAGLKGPGDARA
jgi:hypothetical protein